MKGSFKLGSVAGIGIFIHWSFALLIGFIVFSNYRAGQSGIQITWAVLFILCIFITVLLHELGHALAAKRYRIKTKDITLLPIGGLARLERIPEKPKEELIVALAGPAVNLAIAAITAVFVSFPDANSLSLALTGGVNASNFFLNFLIVNLWLALFNLIPAFPMDGGRVLRALLSMRMTRTLATSIAARIGQALAIGFVILGFYANPFLIFIGLFIFLGAQAEASVTQAQALLTGYTVRDVVMHHFETLDTRDTVATAVRMLLDGQNKAFLVMDNQEPVGTVSRDEIIRALTKQGDGAIVQDFMNRELISLDANLPLEKAYMQLQQHKSDLMPVWSDHRLVGVVDRENMMEFLMVRNALTKPSS